MGGLSPPHGPPEREGLRQCPHHPAGSAPRRAPARSGLIGPGVRPAGRQRARPEGKRCPDPGPPAAQSPVTATVQPPRSRHELQGRNPCPEGATQPASSWERSRGASSIRAVSTWLPCPPTGSAHGQGLWTGQGGWPGSGPSAFVVLAKSPPRSSYQSAGPSANSPRTRLEPGSASTDARLQSPALCSRPRDLGSVSTAQLSARFVGSASRSRVCVHWRRPTGQACFLIPREACFGDGGSARPPLDAV